MSPLPGLAGLAGLLLVAHVSALYPPHTSLRDLPPSVCGFAHYGSAVGSAQRLVETHLSPGVADWNIVVPMPPPCADAQVTGVDMRVCDADATPDVSMSDVRSARVHRAGSLAGFAAVNVTVYCILPPPPLTPPPPPPALSPAPSPPTLTLPPAPPLPPSTLPPAPPPPSSDPSKTSSVPRETGSTEELSNELKSFEADSNEEISDESELNVSASIEETTTVKPTTSTTTTKPTSSATSPPPPEQTTARAELALPTKVVAHSPNKMPHPKEKKPQTIQVTINITPTNQMSTEEDEPNAYDVELPLISNKEKKKEVTPSHNATFSEVPIISTPSRFPEMPLQTHAKRPHRPRGPQHRPPPRSLPLLPTPAPARGPPLYAPPFPPLYQPRAPYDVPPFPMAPSNPTVPFYRPFSFNDPWLRFLQRRQPLIYYRQF